jgi:aspartate racemase
MAKNIGILGGMTPESTTVYYEHITRTYIKRYGDYGFPQIIIFSVSFQQYEDWMTAGQWDKIAQGLSEAVQSVAKAGADFAVIATNTMHIVFPQIEKNSPIPLLSIIDATAEAIRERGMKTIGLLGTRFTMTEPFYKEGLEQFGIKTIVPDEQDRKTVDDIVFHELGKGEIRDDSRRKYVDIVKRLHRQGAEGVILGCTEIPLLINEKDCGVPLFNTTVIHAEKALAYALSS